MTEDDEDAEDAVAEAAAEETDEDAEAVAEAAAEDEDDASDDVPEPPSPAAPQSLKDIKLDRSSLVRELSDLLR